MMLNIVARPKHLLPIVLRKGSLSDDDDDDENSSPMYEQDHAINIPLKKASSGNADSSKVPANKDDHLEVRFQ